MSRNFQKILLNSSKLLKITENSNNLHKIAERYWKIPPAPEKTKIREFQFRPVRPILANFDQSNLGIRQSVLWIREVILESESQKASLQSIQILYIFDEQ